MLVIVLVAVVGNVLIPFFAPPVIAPGPTPAP
jgi:hypothetical protein